MLPLWLSSKESACIAGDPGSIPGSGRSLGGGNGNPFQILAWKTPWTEKPGRLYSIGSQRVGHDWSKWTHKSKVISELYIHIKLYYKIYQRKKSIQKNLNDQKTHNGVITHLEPDILESEIKWALGSITVNKASRGDGTPAELFQILKKGCCC